MWETTAGSFYGLAYRKTSGTSPFTGGSSPSASANWTLLQLPNTAGVLQIANGGTGTTSAAGARTNLGSTAVGDAVFIAANAAAARSTLAAAASGSNNDITSLTALTTIPTATIIGGFTVGYKELPQNVQSSSYTLVSTDAGKHILHPTADTTARTFTIPSNAAVPFPIGTTITVINQYNAGLLTISINSDVMRIADSGLTGSRTLSANGICNIIKVTNTEWFINGVGLS